MKSTSENFLYDDIALWQWETQSDEFLINEAFASFLGYTALELSPMSSDSYKALVHPADVTSREEMMQGYLQGELSHYECELRLLHKNGEWIWVCEYAKISSQEKENSPRLVSGHIYNINRYKNSQLELSASQHLLHNIINEMPDVFVLKDENGNFLLCNQTVANLYKTTPKEMVGKNDGDFGVPKELNDFFIQNVLSIMKKGKTEIVYEDSVDVATGDIHHFRSIKKPLKDEQGKNQILVIAQDITEIVQAKEKVAKNERRLNEVFEATQEGIWDWEIATGAVIHNSQWYKALGFEENELSDNVEAFSGQIHPEDRDLVWQKIQNLLNAATSEYYSEHRMLCKNGDVIWVQDRGKIAEYDSNGNPLRVVGSFSDITNRKHHEQSLLLSSSVFTHAREGIMITDANTKILKVNRAFSEITGFSQEEVVGQSPQILKSDKHQELFYKHLWSDLAQKGHWNGEIYNRRKNGEIYPLMLTISSVKNETNEVLNYVALFSDITLQKEHEEELLHIANYDHLTGLPNRLLLSDRLNQAILQTKRDNSTIIIAFVDLDSFKEVNDRYGHSIGDELLKKISLRMQMSLRQDDTLARIGGDEFVAIFKHHENNESPNALFNKLLSIISDEIIIEHLTFNVSASIGVTFYSKENQLDADQLLRQADQAMYQAKLSGKNCFHIFDTKNDQVLRKHHQILHDIENALINQEFELYYQPKIDFRSRQTIGMEALIRWNHPTKGFLSPALFLPEIEFHTLGIQVGEWVIATALKELQRLASLNIFLPLSVNITANHFQQTNFVDRMKILLNTFPNANPELLEIEILETSIIQDIGYVIDVIQKCLQLGIQFSLDDFGTGFSSLSYLKKLPIQTIKIDQGFVRDILTDPEDAKIISGIMGLASAFEKKVIAEGVEDEEHIVALIKLGCFYGQGYCIARPMPAEKLSSWIKTNDSEELQQMQLSRI